MLFRSACIGKWHIDGHGRSNFIPRERRQGFDYWKVLECTHAYNRSPYYADGPEKLFWEGYDAAAQTRDAQRYLADPARQKKPFLLWLAWGPPHNPYETAPAKYRERYAADKLQLRPNVPPSHATPARAWLAGYYAHCTALDDLFGQYERMKVRGVSPYWTINHGMTLSAYYRDPDGNQVETQVDSMSMEEADAFMAGPLFAANPIGINVDFEELIARHRAGASFASITDYATAGK